MPVLLRCKISKNIDCLKTNNYLQYFMRSYKNKSLGSSFWPVCFLSLSLLIVTSSCGILRPSKQSQVERRQAKEAQKAQTEYDKAVEAHMKNQSDETRKMMKKTKKKAKGFNRFMKKSPKRSPGC